jgi:hypothetical protein
VRQYLQRFEIPADMALLDPFCGTGTTLVEAKKHGVASVGCDGTSVRPRWLSRAKTNWAMDLRACDFSSQPFSMAQLRGMRAQPRLRFSENDVVENLSDDCAENCCPQAF